MNDGQGHLETGGSRTQESHEIVEGGHFGARRLAKVVKVARAEAVIRAASSRTGGTGDDWKFFFIFHFYFGFQDQSARAGVVLWINPRSI